MSKLKNLAVGAGSSGASVVWYCRYCPAPPPLLGPSVRLSSSSLRGSSPPTVRRATMCSTKTERQSQVILWSAAVLRHGVAAARAVARELQPQRRAQRSPQLNRSTYNLRYGGCAIELQPRLRPQICSGREPSVCRFVAKQPSMPCAWASHSQFAAQCQSRNLRIPLVGSRQGASSTWQPRAGAYISGLHLWLIQWRNHESHVSMSAWP